MALESNTVTDLTWRRSTRCDTNACAEVATYPNVVYLRNSAEPGKVLAFTQDEWDAFVAAAKDGGFDAR